MSERTCSVEACDTRAIARGWCRRHYSRWHVHGDPLGTAPEQPKRLCSEDKCDEPHLAKGYCRKHYKRVSYQANIERERAKQREYRARDPQKWRDGMKQWRARNPESAKAHNRRWYKANALKVRLYKRGYRDRNRDNIRVLNNRRKALKRNAPINDLTGSQWREIKATYGQRCVYCGKKPKKLTMDHVIPLSKGGSHTASNIVPACGPCNSQKNDGNAPTYQPLLL